MKNLIIIVSIIFSNLIFSQTDKCSVEGIQLDIYAFVLNNLNQINKTFEDKNSLVEVSIDFKKHTIEQEEKKEYTEIKNIDYYLILPEDSYSGENKEKIKVYQKLDKKISDKINSCIANSTQFKEQLYGNITFRVPLNEVNIGIAIEQVKSRINE